MKLDPNETIMGIDYGESNVGLALGRNRLVSPLKILSGKNEATAIHEISRMALENKVSKYIVGLPLNHNGHETKQSLRVRKFVKLLKILGKKPVEFINEHSSTQEAAGEMLDQGIAQRRRQNNDHFSAAIILKRYYDEQHWD